MRQGPQNANKTAATKQRRNARQRPMGLAVPRRQLLLRYT